MVRITRYDFLNELISGALVILKIKLYRVSLVRLAQRYMRMYVQSRSVTPQCHTNSTHVQ